MIALKLAQASILSDSSLFLIDDLASELDIKTIKAIIEYLNNNNIQTIITSLDATTLPCQDLISKMFHVKHGKVV